MTNRVDKGLSLGPQVLRWDPKGLTQGSPVQEWERWDITNRGPGMQTKVKEGMGCKVKVKGWSTQGFRRP